ncbi:hypothetical protein FOL47_009529 [Perkinsus chesapeaki]|uniref:Proteasome activator PA28 C-terminal domain-containing protein n=1 Tax=Perkinsus chesapeaki TaxID=330153 RepID=A0A7J6MRL6_PERCH|nr:hypothetical protein FOL47_009529 [Perkinsus chesapeaki]
MSVEATSELTIEEAQAQLDVLLDVFDGDGERVMKELPLYVIKLEKDLKTVFNLQGDIQQVQEAFAAKECSLEGIRSGKAHPELLRINQYIAKAIEDGLERLGQMQRFVIMHTPIEEDGNNFGVAVQSRFYAKVSKYVKWCESLQEGCKAYHAIRADILRKMELDKKLEVRENYSGEAGDKVLLIMVDPVVTKKRRLSNGAVSTKEASTASAASAQEKLDELIKRFDSVGEDIMKELPSIILDLEDRVPKIFNRTEDIVELEEAFARKECSAEGIQSGKPNPVIVEVNKIVTKEFDQACERLSRLQRFVLMHIPREEDGNNFGVEVQAQFNGKLGEYLKWCDDTQDENKVYHQARAEIIRQMEFERAVEERETVCEKDDKVVAVPERLEEF